jgi:hypothetical protein
MTMMTNVGVLDAALRLACGVALLAWGDGRFGDDLSDLAAWIVWIAGMVLGLTAVFRYCPVYALLGTNSCAAYPHRNVK